MQSSLTTQLIRFALDARHVIDKASDSQRTDIVETQVYIGLNDSETRKQEFETNRYISVLKRVCVKYGVPFSFDVINGGYIHDDGEYTEEKTIVLTFIDVDQETVDEIAKDLCVFFHQESVLVTTDHIEARSIREVVTP